MIILKENRRWKPLLYRGVSYEERFMVSDNGDIYSLRSKKILKKTIINGYEQICISTGNRQSKKVIKIHIAVAENFVAGKQNGLIVNHIDGNKTNNNYNNLEWVTPKENIQHAVKNELLVRGPKIICINTGEIFLNISEAARWCGLNEKANALREYFTKPGRTYSGRHPITGEKLTWKLLK